MLVTSTNYAGLQSGLVFPLKQEPRLIANGVLLPD